MTKIKDKAKILMVDDKPENLVVLEKILLSLNVELYKATSGNAALALTLEHDFMLILLDVQMPIMDGYEVLEMLSWEDRTRYIPVIFITANYADERHELKGYSVGAVDYLFKPINKHILLSKVKVFLELYEQRMRYQQLHQRYQLILDSAGEGIFGLDLEGIITFTNPAAAKLLGYTVDELLGLSFSMMLPFDETNEPFIWKHNIIQTTCKNGEIYANHEAIFFKIDGLKLSVGYTASPLYDHDEFIGIVIVFSDISLQKTVEEQLKQLALYDHLTELPNRLLFEKSITQIISRAERHNRMIAVMFLDLDHFKNVNDTLGHDVGDLLLKGVGKRLKTCIRESDVVSRLGGDEFAIILDEIDQPEDAALVAEKVLDILKPPFKLKHHEVFTGTSIGIAVFPLSGADGQTLTKNADVAMYRAKQQGRNTYRFFTSGMNERSLQRLNLAHHLRTALEYNELYLAYQPKVSLKTNVIVGMEALLRWEHPQLGTIYPEEIISIAEEIGLMSTLGKWTLKTACIHAKEWLTTPGSTMAVNLSSSQLIKGNLEKIVREALQEADLNPNQLELELTETSIMVNPEQSHNTLINLHKFGIHLAIDDFGTGYSSLTYLRSLPLNTLKIDRSFIDDIDKNENDAIIVRAIIGLGHNMNLNVVAEGVEREEQLAFLKMNECDQIQGFLFSKPLTADEMRAFLANYREN